MRHTARRLLAALLALFMILPLSGCALDSFLTMLGFDVYNYRGEAAVAAYGPDDEVTLKLKEFLGRLTVLSPFLKPFYGGKDAADSCRDAVLFHMLGDNFARYAGNPVLLEKARAAYPSMQLQVLIPASDLETEIYSMFGGAERITHQSGELFEYLEDIRSYTAAMVPEEAGIEVVVLRCEETERSYRIWFRNMIDNLASPEYLALFVKRDDGTFWCKYLEEVR